MFQLSDHESSMTNLNSRIERHGDSRELAVDLKFETKASNTVLDSLEKGLKESLFRKPGKGEQQELIEGNQLVAVKHTCLEPLRLSHEFAGYELTIEGALGVADPIDLVDVKLKKFVITPMEGGSVGVSFTASANVDSGELADLSEALIREDVRLTLTPPSKQAGEATTDLAEAA